MENMVVVIMSMVMMLSQNHTKLNEEARREQIIQNVMAIVVKQEEINTLEKGQITPEIIGEVFDDIKKNEKDAVKRKEDRQTEIKRRLEPTKEELELRKDESQEERNNRLRLNKEKREKELLRELWNRKEKVPHGIGGVSA